MIKAKKDCCLAEGFKFDFLGLLVVNCVWHSYSFASNYTFDNPIQLSPMNEETEYMFGPFES